jgi:hypothetical protein
LFKRGASGHLSISGEPRIAVAIAVTADTKSLLCDRRPRLHMLQLFRSVSRNAFFHVHPALACPPIRCDRCRQVACQSGQITSDGCGLTSAKPGRNANEQNKNLL